MASLLDLLQSAPLLLAVLALFGLTRDGGWWQPPAATADAPAAVPLRLGP